MTFADELNSLMARRGITQAQVAKDLGVSRQAVQFWAAGRSEPKGANLFKFREYALQDLPDAEVQTFRVTDDRREPVEDNWLRVNVLDVYASCGGGTYGDDGDQIVGAIDFYKPFLRELPGVSALHNDFDIIHSSGDSMAPTIQRRAICLIDKKQNQISDDAIYCLRTENNLFIKRVLRNFDGSITLISDNNRYPPQRVNKELLDNACVIGRVVLVLNADVL